jgi:phosphate butyryltransferase
MPLRGFDDLFREADNRAPGISVVAAGGADRTVLEALRAATDRGWITPLVVGPEAEIRRLADEAAIGLEGFTIIDVNEDRVAPRAVETVRSGRAAILMKGRVSTPTLLRAVLDPAEGLRTGRVVCQVVLMEIVRDLRRFLLADTGITIRPEIASKIEIMKSAVEVAQALGEPSPRVALMAATEKASVSMPETLHAAEIQHRNEAGDFPGCRIQGPLSFDLAYAADAADKKRIGGPVVGAADVMIFPDLASANLTVKAIMYTADCRFGGILKGTSAPVVFMSRADTTETRLRSLALALGSLSPGRVE